MRLYWRFILKWLVFIGALIIVFKLCCDALVYTFLAASSSSILNVNQRNTDTNYEQSLIAWAETGQHLNNRKMSAKNIRIRNHLQLIGAQIFFRHGARTPLKLLPTLEEV